MAFRVSLREDERNLVHQALQHLAAHYGEKITGTISEDGEKLAFSFTRDQLVAVAAKFAPQTVH